MSLFGPAGWTFEQNEADVSSPTTSGQDLPTTKPDVDEDDHEDSESVLSSSSSRHTVDEEDSDVSSAGYWEGQFETSQNRFKGSARTYRKYIAAERNLYDEVLQQADKDLPLHLLAAHTLSRSILKDERSTRLTENSRARKQVKNPLDAWTRCPNRPEQNDVFHRHHAVTDLRECISAFLQKQGRELCGDEAEVQTNSPIALSTNSGSRADSVHSETEGALSFSPSVGSPTSSRSFAESSRSDTSQYDEPAYSADQVYLDALTLPVASHMLSRLDQLLFALDSPRAAAHRSNTTSKTSVSKAKAQKKRSLGDGGVVDDEGSHPGAVDESTEVPTRRGLVRHQPRDWSEVLGTAAVMGWDRTIIDVATKRCASLFKETLAFTTLEAGHPRKSTNNGEETWRLEDLRCPHQDCVLKAKDWPSKKRLAEHIRRYHHWNPTSESMPVQTFGGVHIDGYMQPIERQKGWREGTTRESDAEVDATARREPSAVRSRKRRAVSDLSRAEG